MEQLDKLAGLSVSVIGMDCTNGGVTSGVDRAVLILPDVPSAAIFSPREGAPALEVEMDENPRGASLGHLAVYEGGRPPAGMPAAKGVRFPPRIVRVRVKPYGKPAGMFGGHYVETSDSRFPFSGPIPVFDRYE